MKKVQKANQSQRFKWIPVANFRNKYFLGELIAAAIIAFACFVLPGIVLFTIIRPPGRFLSTIELLLYGWFPFVMIWQGLVFFREAQESVRLAKSFKGDILCCFWCASFFPHEIWKAIAQLLEERNLSYDIQYRKGYHDFGLLAPFVQAPDFQKKKRRNLHFSPPNLVFLVPEHKTGIALVHSIVKSTNWIYVGEIMLEQENPDGDTFRASLKEEIKQAVEGLAAKNSFCKRCKGNLRSHCYPGGRSGTWDVSPPLTRKLDQNLGRWK